MIGLAVEGGERASSALPEITDPLNNRFAAAQQKTLFGNALPEFRCIGKGLVRATVLIRAKFVFFVFLPERASPLTNLKMP